MSFYSGDLKTVDLGKMYEEIQQDFFVKRLEKDISEDFVEKSQDIIMRHLKENGSIYYSFAKRKSKYLICANGEKYQIDDERSVSSQGIYMADAYFNEYDDINVGYVVSYDEGKIKIYPAIEGESINCRKCEIIEDCGDLKSSMLNFLQEYII